jgi:hypothetical protein
LKSVLLPAPLRPTIDTISPLPTLKSSLSKMGTLSPSAVWNA